MRSATNALGNYLLLVRPSPTEFQVSIVEASMSADLDMGDLSKHVSLLAQCM